MYDLIGLSDEEQRRIVMQEWRSRKEQEFNPKVQLVDDISGARGYVSAVGVKTSELVGFLKRDLSIRHIGIQEVSKGGFGQWLRSRVQSLV